MHIYFKNNTKNYLLQHKNDFHKEQDDIYQMLNSCIWLMILIAM